MDDRHKIESKESIIFKRDSTITSLIYTRLQSSEPEIGLDLKYVSHQEFIQREQVNRISQRKARRRVERKHEKKVGLAKARLERNSLYRQKEWDLPVNLNHHPIFLPETLSFSKNFDETAKAFSELKRVGLREGEPICVHLDKITELEPSAALVLVAEIFRLKFRGRFGPQKSVTGTYPQSPELHRLLSEMGFFSTIQVIDNLEAPDKHPDEIDELLWIHFRTGNRVDTEFIHNFVSIIETHVIDITIVARQRLIGAVKEATQNALDHAYKVQTKFPALKNRWYLSASLSRKSHEVRIMLYDQGVGISETMDLTTFESIKLAAKSVASFGRYRASEGEMIKAATELWRTSTDIDGRGKGFRNMKEFIDQCGDGELRIYSNRGKYTYIDNVETYDDMYESVGGTLIEWRFSTDKTLDLHDA